MTAGMNTKKAADETPHPPIVSREEWLAERKKLLSEEKE